MSRLFTAIGDPSKKSKLLKTHFSRWATGRNPPPPPPPGGNFRPILDRSISYPNPKLTCYAKIQCRLQELWPLESHSVKKKIFLGGGFFLSYRHHILFAKKFRVILGSENIYVQVL